jgi:hypothetical protein
VDLYFVRGATLAAARRQIAASDTDIHVATIRALLSGPSKSEIAAGLSSPFAQNTYVRDLSIGDGVALVQSNPALFEPGSQALMQARIAAIVFTLTQFPSVQRVEFQIGQNPIASFAGIRLSRPIGRGDVLMTLPTLLVNSPAFGDSIHSPLTVDALAGGSGAYSIQLFDASGKQVLNAIGTMVAGTSFRDSYPFTLVMPGMGEIKVITTTVSGSPSTALDLRLPISA